jgi:nucleotide-binding universal stress UspA family protein
MNKKTAVMLIDAQCSEADIRSYVGNLMGAPVHISFLMLKATPPMPMAAYGAIPYGPVIFPDNWQDQYKQDSDALSVRANEIEAILQAEGAEGDVGWLYCDTVNIGIELGPRVAVCDHVFVSPDLMAQEHVFRAALHAILFNSPVGVILNGKDIAATLAPKRVFVAWKGDLPAARALHQALPLLIQAEQVTVATFSPAATEVEDGEDPGADVATWLSRHGCNVTLSQYPDGGNDIADCIQDRARETGADLVVMGAYGHSRARQALFGGTTQSMITQTELPVLLAH